MPLASRRDVLGRAVAHMGAIEHRLLRPLSTWTPRARGARRRWRELVAHTCLAYPQPQLLETCFLEHALADDVRAVAPFIGLGGSWRDAGLPAHLTRASAHALSTTKEHFHRLTNAVRAAQMKTAGVAPSLARALIWKYPAWGFDLDREELWLDFFGWLARHPDVDREDLSSFVDFYASCDRSFTTKGRTTSSFVALVKEDARQQKLKDEGRLNVGPLPRCGIDGGAYVLLKEQIELARRFTIEQIVDGGDLVEEGIAMKHCVGTYAEQAKAGTTAIFSLKVARFDNKPRRALTIEVEVKTKSVEQVRGKANRSIDDEEKAILACWARERDLKIDQYAY